MSDDTPSSHIPTDSLAEARQSIHTCISIAEAASKSNQVLVALTEARDLTDRVRARMEEIRSVQKELEAAYVNADISLRSEFEELVSLQNSLVRVTLLLNRKTFEGR